MLRQLLNHKANIALFLLFLSLLAYSSMGVFLHIAAAQNADRQPITHQPVFEAEPELLLEQTDPQVVTAQ